jgi:hypothetical protein
MKTIFAFTNYFEFVSPSDNSTVIRLPIAELDMFKEDGDVILYEFTYSDLSPEQKAILHQSEDPIAVKLLNNFPSRSKAEMRALTTVTPAQIRLALIENGISLATITNALNAIEDSVEREKATVLWEYANVVERNNPFVNAIGTMLGKTPEEIDAIFSLAQTLA